MVCFTSNIFSWGTPLDYGGLSVLQQEFSERGHPIFLLGWGWMRGWWDTISSSAKRVSQTASQTCQQHHATQQGDLDEEINHDWTLQMFILLCDSNGPGQTLVGSRYPPPSPPHTLSQTHTAGQSFFTQPNGPLTGLGEGLPLWKTDWQDWHFHIVQLIMGICLEAPVWGPSRVHGCCHRDGGEPLVAWGADRDPVILLRGGQTRPPVTLLFWFGWETASSQPGEKRRVPGPADP